jgi:DNA topoisomerase-3
LKTLIVAEKASAAKDFRAGLEIYGAFKDESRSKRCFESDKYVITWMQGHLLSIKEPIDYDPTWKTNWSLSRLPWYPDAFGLKLPDKTKDIFAQVSAIMKRTDLNLIINACDAGREGELIFWEAYDFLKLKLPSKRFFESAELTPKNIQRIMDKDLKEEAFFKPRRDAAYARSHADLLLGMNFTIGFTAKAKTLLHMGRVQTPTLGFLVDRELEIRKFIEECYYEVEADFGKYKGQWFKGELSLTRIDKKEDAQAIVTKTKGKIGVITKKDVKKEEKPHPLLFSLTTLQQEANRKFGFTPSETLDACQKLYDEFKYTSYPRTDSEVMGEAHIPSLEPRLKAMAVGDYKPFADHILATGIKVTKRFVDNSKLTDHHAIVPTEVKPDVARLGPMEAKIYDLIAKRFLSVFYPAAIYEKTNIVTEIEKETFKTTGSILVSPGWKVVYGTAEEEEEEEDDKKKKTAKKETEIKLPILNLGESNPSKNVAMLEKKTKPPKRYTDADLLGVMKNPTKFLSDEDLQEAIKAAGLGTSATRDAIISKIVRDGYVNREKKFLIPTEKAILLIEVAPDELKSPQITAEWEQKLREIEEGKYDNEKFMDEIKAYIRRNIQKLEDQNLSVSFDHADAKKVGKCPECGNDVVEKDKVFCCVKNTKEPDTCRFVIFKTIGEKKISLKIAKQLMEKKQTEAIDGFMSKAKKTFRASLVWKEQRVQYSFDEPVSKTTGKATATATKSITCPYCEKGSIRETKLGFGCTNWQQGCKFTVWKEYNGKKMTMKIVEELILKKSTAKMTGFKNKSGEDFSASLVLDMNEKKVKMQY